MEDESGTPFVGRAGRILNLVLQQTKIDRSQVFITNIVKCRPPRNRTPTGDEIAACRNYLDRQIAFLKPTHVGLLGRTAYSSIIGGNEFKSNRGRILKKNGVKYLVTIHPAAVIYNKSLIGTLKSDFSKLSSELKS